LTLPVFELRPFRRSACSQSLYRLRYLGSPYIRVGVIYAQGLYVVTFCRFNQRDSGIYLLTPAHDTRLEMHFMRAVRLCGSLSRKGFVCRPSEIGRNTLGTTQQPCVFIPFHYQHVECCRARRVYICTYVLCSNQYISYVYKIEHCRIG
jgi:hypothetical protein